MKKSEEKKIKDFKVNLGIAIEYGHDFRSEIAESINNLKLLIEMVENNSVDQNLLERLEEDLHVTNSNFGELVNYLCDTVEVIEPGFFDNFCKNHQ